MGLLPCTGHSMKHPFSLLAGLLLISIGSILLSLAIGSVSLSAADIWGVITGDSSGIAATVINELRAPRIYIAFVTGALLALSGVIMQVLLVNPLADPYILGVSSGASVAAITAMALGLGGLWISGSAFCGALLTILLVFGLAHLRGQWNPSRLLLTGVVVAAGWSAMINFILAASPEKPLRGMLFWLMGDISSTRADLLPLITLLVGGLVTFSLARHLNLLARGDQQASALGVSVGQLRMILFFLSSILTAVAVVQAGSIGFIGLIVPHMIRLMHGSDHRVLIPAAILLGGSLLVISDTLARSIIAPQQLPLGVITAFIGVPFLLYLLNRQQARNTPL